MCKVDEVLGLIKIHGREKIEDIYKMLIRNSIKKVFINGSRISYYSEDSLFNKGISPEDLRRGLDLYDSIMIKNDKKMEVIRAKFEKIINESNLSKVLDLDICFDFQGGRYKSKITQEFFIIFLKLNNSIGR